MGIVTPIVGAPVIAHNVLTTAESIPPDTPMIRDFNELSFRYSSIQLEIFSIFCEVRMIIHLSF